MNLTFPVSHAPAPTGADSDRPAQPWAQLALAWVNGVLVFSPLRAVPVRKRHPRTLYLVLGKPR